MNISVATRAYLRTYYPHLLPLLEVVDSPAQWHALATLSAPRAPHARSYGGAVMHAYALRMMEGAALHGGHWITVAEDGIDTHLYVSHAHGSHAGGRVLAGPKHLIGANIAHLPPGPTRTHIMHGSAEPTHGRSHPHFAMHRYALQRGNGNGVPPPKELSEEETKEGYALSRAAVQGDGRFATPGGDEKEKDAASTAPSQKIPSDPSFPTAPEEIHALGKKARAELQDYVYDHEDAAIADYHRRFGNVVNTDLVRELSPTYAASKESRTALASAVHPPSTYFKDMLYSHMLHSNARTKPVVVLTGGGAGAGKSTAISGTGPLAEQLKDCRVVLDTAMSSYAQTTMDIQQALNTGNSVVIAYVWRDAEDAFVHGVLPRAAEEGRTVPIHDFLRVHVQSLKTIKQVVKQYAHNPHVAIFILDNSRGRGKQALIPAADLEEKHYDEEALSRRLYARLEEEHDAGRVSDRVYAATKKAGW